MRGGAPVERRICDQEVAGSIPVGARLRNDSGQVVHTRLPRRRQSLLYGVVEPEPFTKNSELTERQSRSDVKPVDDAGGWRFPGSRSIHETGQFYGGFASLYR